MKTDEDETPEKAWESVKTDFSSLWGKDLWKKWTNPGQARRVKKQDECEQEQDEREQVHLFI